MKLSNILFAAGIVGLSLSSCYKKKETKAIITVVSDNGSPVAGAAVKLYIENPTQNLNPEIEKEGVTDASGKATFDYTELHQAGQAGFAVLDIDIENGTASGIIKIEAEATSEETVICSGC